MPASVPATLAINTRVRVHHIRVPVETTSARFLSRIVSHYIGLEGTVGADEILHNPDMVLVNFSKPAGPYTCLLFYPDELEVLL